MLLILEVWDSSLTVCAACWVAGVKIVFRAPPFAIDYIFELCLWCFFSVNSLVRACCATSYR